MNSGIVGGGGPFGFEFAGGCTAPPVGTVFSSTPPKNPLFLLLPNHPLLLFFARLGRADASLSIEGGAPYGEPGRESKSDPDIFAVGEAIC